MQSQHISLYRKEKIPCWPLKTCVFAAFPIPMTFQLELRSFEAVCELQVSASQVREYDCIVLE